MIEAPIAHHLDSVFSASLPFVRFLTGSAWAKRAGADGISDFVVGNPHEMPMPAYVQAIQRASIPRNADWFGYKTNEPIAREVAARSLADRLGLPFEPDDIFMTKGASNALVVALSTILDPGDEVIFLSPPWFFYESMIAFVHGVPVRVSVDLATFDVDVAAIEAAITPRTRAVIVSSPNNPTGKIYPPATLARLAKALGRASDAFGRAIYLISDESYSRLTFDGRRFESPTAHYPYTFLVYSYAKALLTPGQRLGYLALAPAMPDRDRMRRAVFATQCSGYGFPDAVLQHALPDLEPLCIDVGRLQWRRDRLVGVLREQGYTVHIPEGAWYLLPRSPIPDDAAFTDLLAAEDVFVLPGQIVELPGYFRISLTASDSMVERSLAGFAAAKRAAEQRQFAVSGASG
jgi:aspartate aminotransferase